MSDADYYVGKQDILSTVVPITRKQTKEEHKSAAAAAEEEEAGEQIHFNM